MLDFHLHYHQCRHPSNADVRAKKGFIRFEENSEFNPSKLLPSIKTNKVLKANKNKRYPKNRDLSMTVIKSGRLAIQGGRTKREESKLNSSMSRDSSNREKRIQFPMSRKEASLILQEYLYDYEQMEILDYDKIYYIDINGRKDPDSREGGLKCKNSKKEKPSKSEFNNGFDNENGDYLYAMKDHIAYRYELMKELGKGSFGSVIKAFDHMKKEFVALKILRNRKKLHKQGMVEINLIKTLNKDDPSDK